MKHAALALVLLVSGCTSGGFGHRRYGHGHHGRGSLLLDAVVLLGAVAVTAARRPSRPRPLPDPPPLPPLPPNGIWGTVVLEDTGQRVHTITVRLHGTNGFVARTTTDWEGRFQFPEGNLPPGPFIVVLEDPWAEGDSDARVGEGVLIEARPKARR